MQNQLNSQKLLKRLLCASALGLMMATVACGGGGGSSPPASVSPPPPPPPSPPPPPPPPPVGSVIYAGNDGSGFKLFAVADNGTQRRTLTGTLSANKRDLIPFEVSPDESWVGVIGAPDGSNQLYVASVDAGAATRVNRVETSGNVTTTVKSFDWSPDSNQLVFAADLDNRNLRPNSLGGFANEIYIIDRDGANELKINGTIGAGPSVEMQNPQWSPSGSHILQEVTPFGATLPRFLNIYNADAGTPNSTRVADAFSFIQDVTWAPNGVNFGFLGDVRGLDRAELWLGSVALGGPDDISDTPSFDNQFVYEPTTSRVLMTQRSPSQDPTADWKFLYGNSGGPYGIQNSIGPSIADLSRVKYAETGINFAYMLAGDLFVTNPNTATPTLLVARSGNQGVSNYEWSPNGQELAFAGNLNLENLSELYVISRDGTNLRTVSIGIGNEQVASEFAFSPDGRKIAFAAGMTAGAPTTLYVANVDGSGVTRLSDPIISDIGQIEYVGP